MVFFFFRKKYVVLCTLSILIAISSVFISIWVFLFYVLAGAIAFFVYRSIFLSDSLFLFTTKLFLLFSFTGSALIVFRIGSISFFPVRILFPILVITLLTQLLNHRLSINEEKLKVKLILTFFGFWLFYAVISLLWVKSLSYGIKEVAFLSLGIFTIYLVVLNFERLIDYLHFFYIWMLMLGTSLVVGLWEYITHHHLSTSSITVNSPHAEVPTAVFYNQNDFATYLTVGVFFIISFIKHKTNVYLRLCGLISLIVLLFLLLMTESRANYLALCAGIVLYFVFLTNPKQKFRIIIYGLPILFVSAVVFRSIFFKTFQKILYVFSVFSGDFQWGHSIQIRINLIKNALAFTLGSFGFGVGSGNATYYLKHYAKFPVSGIYDLHNWWAELLTNYGVLIFFTYVVIYLSLVFFLYKKYQSSCVKHEKMIYEALLGGLFVFPLAVMSPSSIIAFNFQWAFIAFAVGFLNYSKTKMEI